MRGKRQSELALGSVYGCYRPLANDIRVGVHKGLLELLFFTYCAAAKASKNGFVIATVSR